MRFLQPVERYAFLAYDFYHACTPDKNKNRTISRFRRGARRVPCGSAQQPAARAARGTKECVLWRLRRAPQFDATLLTHLEEDARERSASEARDEAEWRKMHRRAYHTAPLKEKSPVLQAPQLLRGQSIKALLTADFSG
jgi:hypothetical protein